MEDYKKNDSFKLRNTFIGDKNHNESQGNDW